MNLKKQKKKILRNPLLINLKDDLISKKKIFFFLNEDEIFLCQIINDLMNQHQLLFRWKKIKNTKVSFPIGLKENRNKWEK